MKSVLKSMMLSLVLGITALLPTNLMGQSIPDPAIVVSISNLDEQLADIKYLLTASGFKEMNFMASATIKGYTQGIDSSKDSGVMLYFTEESETPDVLGFVPVTDLDAFLDVVAGMAEIDEDGDNYIVVAPDGSETIIKEVGGYAFFTNKEAMLGALPSNPAGELGDLPKRFNLAARVMPQRVPQVHKDKIMELIKQGADGSMGQMDGGGIPEELQKKNLEMQMKQLEMVLEQTDRLTIGFAADEDTESLYMDVVFTGLDGSELAKKMAESKPTTPSRFSGFLMDGAAFTMNSNSRMSSDDAQTYGNMLDEFEGSLIEEMNQEGDFSDDEFAAMKKSLNNVFDALKQTMQEGVIDAGAVVLLENDDLNFASGMQVIGARKIEASVKELVPLMQQRASEDEDLDLTVNLNSGTYKGITFHEFLIGIPESEEEARQAFGEKMTVAVGVGDKELYFGAGTNPVDVIKKGMDETHSAAALQQFNVYVEPIMQAASRMGAPPEVMIMAEKLAEVGKDRVSAVSKLVENGVETRFEMQDGILSLIKVGVESFQSNGFPRDDF